MKIFDFESNFVRNFSVFVFFTINCNSTADHHVSDVCCTCFADWFCSNVCTVTKDCNCVSYAYDFVKTVADKDDTDAFVCKTADSFEQVFCFSVCKNSCWFVKYKDFDTFFVNFTCNFDKLHMTNRQACNLCIAFDIHIKSVESLCSVFVHLFVVKTFKTFTKNFTYNTVCCDFAVEFDVFCNCEAWNKHKFLMNHTDTVVHSFVWGFDFDFFAINKYGAFKATCFVDCRHTEENVHQCRFTGTVFADKSVNFALFNCHTNIFKYLVSVERLGDVFKFQQFFAQG